MTWTTLPLSSRPGNRSVAGIPGWVILPEDRRLTLWLETRRWTGKVPAKDVLPGVLDIEFAFEMAWRMEKCLSPIFDKQVDFLEATLNRYWPVTNSRTPPESPPVNAEDLIARDLTLEEVRHMCHYLILTMMRHYREEGFGEKWTAMCRLIQEVETTLSPGARSTIASRTGVVRTVRPESPGTQDPPRRMAA